MNSITFKDLVIGLLAAMIGGAVNGAAVAAATGFTFDAAHFKAIAGAAVVGGLFNASMYLKTPQRTREASGVQELSGPQAPVPTSKPEQVKP